MSPTLYGKTDIDCCRLGIQEYYAHSCIVTNPWQCLSHPYDVDTAYNNICSRLYHTY